ncbi:MAG: hypothetical protein LBC64_00460 [Fibromonadaceae bacterium]|jgi:hypothetical protein|nr:hypothetical protein [Fibromonadaceae bacterium]
MKKKYAIFVFMGFLLTSCATKRFDINAVDFSYQYIEQNILPLKFHDRSSVTLETADKIVKGFSSKDTNAWGYYYISHSFDRTERKLFDIINIDYITFILHVVGVPEARVNHTLVARVYLFDSKGDIVEIYEKTGFIMTYRGLWYGYNLPIDKMAEEYKKMFQEIINDISASRDRTNEILLMAGTMESDDMAGAYTKIYMIIK